ncbi:MAG: sel1 repeat family protein [Harvfovirus sp.]|uniref:Sel1 repeat family protein n=1 Tax=Harvfovirus sp. TaxID=2487768 RepID=A0A3G5A1S8_9VIRU|nr:MAG: sel1 repeat family protein [Harvfovirus sp.]
MGATVSAALEETKKAINEALDAKEDLLLSSKVKSTIAALTEADRKLLTDWFLDKNSDVLLIVASVTSDLAKAHALIRLAANSNNPNAYFQLGKISTDPCEIKKCMERAVELKHSGAITWLGVQHDHGYVGYPLDREKSFKCYVDAFALNPLSRLAAYNIGCHYREGRSVDYDYDEAMDWFKKAAHLGDIDALYQMGLLNKDVAGGISLAITNFTEVIRLDGTYSNAIYQLALLYKDDEKRHIEFLQKGVSLGHPESHNTLGELYLKTNEAEGLILLEKAARLGIGAGYYNLAAHYAMKPESYFKALKYFYFAQKLFVSAANKMRCDCEIKKLMPFCVKELLLQFDHEVKPVEETESDGVAV